MVRLSVMSFALYGLVGMLHFVYYEFIESYKCLSHGWVELIWCKGHPDNDYWYISVVTGIDPFVFRMTGSILFWPISYL